MSSRYCLWPSCEEVSEYICNCAFPGPSLCLKHLKEHLKMKGNHYYNNLLLDIDIKDTKKLFLSFLKEENNKVAKLKKKIITYSNQMIMSIKNIVEETTKGLSSDLIYINNCYEKVSQVEKKMKFNEDPILMLLSLAPEEAISRFQENLRSTLSEKLLEIKKLVKEHDLNEKKVEKYENSFNNSKIDVYWKSLNYLKCNELENIDSINDIALNTIGRLHFDEKRYEESLNCFNNSIKINPNCEIYYLNKGYSLLELGRNEEAMKCCIAANRIEQRKVSICEAIGNISYDVNIYNEKLKFYSDEIQASPNEARNYINKAIILRLLDRRFEAKEYCNQAIEINEKEDKVYNEIGIILNDEKQFEEAIKYFKDAIRINPNNKFYYTIIGEALYELGRKNEAIEFYSNAIDKGKNNRALHTLLSCIFRNEKIHEKAIKYFNEKIRINPKYEGYPYLLDNKRYEVLKNFCEFIKIDLDQLDNYNWTGNILEHVNKYEEAIKYYSEAIRINQNCAIYLAKKGIIFCLLHKRDKAMECYQEAIKINPNEDYIYNLIGIIFYDNKQYEEADKYFNDAIRINPKIAFYYINKGNALSELGESNKAILKNYRKAIIIDENYDDAYFWTGVILAYENIYEGALYYVDRAIEIIDTAQFIIKIKEIYFFF